MNYENTYEGNKIVLCPVCKGNYNHVDRAVSTHGKDFWAAPWWGRGNLLTVMFNCEQGHKWELCFGNHKGNLYEFIKIVKD